MRTTSLVVAAVQMRFRAAVDDNVSWITETIRTSARAGADVILLPECAVTGYNRDLSAVSSQQVDAALAQVARATRSARCHVLVGSPTFASGKRFNSLVVLNRQGREIFRYSKIHLTARDVRSFARGNTLALFTLDGIRCTAIVCHERRYPELVRLPVMLGAQIVFHPNAGLDKRSVSRAKRGGRDGIPARAFENEVFYVFANSVGPQGDGLWSAGDSKIVAPDGRVLALADNRAETVIMAELDLSRAGRRYAQEALQQPAFLRPHWRAMLDACKQQLHKGRAANSNAGARVSRP
jgi:predicted amidohydrolase